MTPVCTEYKYARSPHLYIHSSTKETLICKSVHLWESQMWLKEKQAKQNPAQEKGSSNCCVHWYQPGISLGEWAGTRGGKLTEWTLCPLTIIRGHKLRRRLDSRLSHSVNIWRYRGHEFCARWHLAFYWLVLFPQRPLQHEWIQTIGRQRSLLPHGRCLWAHVKDKLQQ